jgi:ABC-type proline/glycine betaine transport system permease subunit
MFAFPPLAVFGLVILPASIADLRALCEFTAVKIGSILSGKEVTRPYGCAYGA